jgi:hypothetical protein
MAALLQHQRDTQTRYAAAGYERMPAQTANPRATQIKLIFSMAQF